MQSEKHFGILLVNTGTPDAPKAHAVRKYLHRFLSDPRIVPMNRFVWWFILHFFILPKRGRTSAEKYRTIWTEEGSPFTIAHEKLVRGLQTQLNQEGIPATVGLAMSYSDPRIKNGISALQQAGCSHLVVLPLYPQSAFSTTGSVRDRLSKVLEKTKGAPPCDFIENYHDNSTYVRALAASVLHAGFRPNSDDKLLFSYHSIPLADIEAGDTYELQTGASSLLIASELGLDRNRWTIGYQCRFDKKRDWLSPYTTEVLARWAEAGTSRTFFICPNFAVDCLETLYDIDHELKPYYFEKICDCGRVPNEDSFIYVPCLDKSRAHVKVLADVVRPYLEGVV